MIYTHAYPRLRASSAALVASPPFTYRTLRSPYWMGITSTRRGYASFCLTANAPFTNGVLLFAGLTTPIGG